MFERRLFFHVDWLLLAAVLLIAAIGAAMIYSTTYVRLPDGSGHAGREFWTQLFTVVIRREARKRAELEVRLELVEDLRQTEPRHL